MWRDQPQSARVAAGAAARTRRWQHAMSIREPRGKAARHTDVTETLVAEPVISSIVAERESEKAVCALYIAHYQSLVRLSALLVRDAATAEEVGHDSFVAMHGGWGRLRDTDKALSY